LETSDWPQGTTINWKQRPRMTVNPHRSLPSPSISWPTMPFLHYTRTTYVGGHIRHLAMEWDWDTKQQLLLGGKRTLNKALNQTLGLEVVKLAIGFAIRLRKKKVKGHGGGASPHTSE
jgi:hypothetical protein